MEFCGFVILFNIIYVVAYIELACTCVYVCSCVITAGKGENHAVGLVCIYMSEQNNLKVVEDF